MRMALLCVLALLATLCSTIAGCGGEGPPGPQIVGFYSGYTAGDGEGVINFFVTATRVLSGNMTLDPICGGRAIDIRGRVAHDGAVTFSGSSCGIDFTGEGQIELDPDAQRYTGSGTWTGSNGTSGTWFADWQGRTGAICC